MRGPSNGRARDSLRRLSRCPEGYSDHGEQATRRTWLVDLQRPWSARRKTEAEPNILRGQTLDVLIAESESPSSRQVKRHDEVTPALPARPIVRRPEIGSFLHLESMVGVSHRELRFRLAHTSDIRTSMRQVLSMVRRDLVRRGPGQRLRPALDPTAEGATAPTATPPHRRRVRRAAERLGEWRQRVLAIRRIGNQTPAKHRHEVLVEAV
jgi:hypothetical protein